MAQKATTIVRPDHESVELVELSRPIAKERLAAWQWVALGGITVLSLFMNFFQLGQNGFPNAFYAAGVRSMLDSWHNFFFVSYDPGGFVTLDKPPLGFWLQVASARVFGFNAFSVLFPQALAGVLAVLLLFYLVRRHFGVGAGLLAALALAISPVSVVTDRNNTIDGTLALVLLLGTWAVLRAAETGRLRWLLLTAAFVGIGFNVKMLEAYLVVPAFGLVYLLAAPVSWAKRIGHLVLAVAVLVLISFSWITAVDLTPTAQRPYVGSTQDNSEMSLAVGYNGIDRLVGMFGRRGGAAGFNLSSFLRNPASILESGSTSRFGSNPGFPAGFQPRADNANRAAQGNEARQTSRTAQGTRTAQGNGAPEGLFGLGGFGGFGGGPFNTGPASLFRLFEANLGGQVSWLLPVAILGALAVAWQRRPRFAVDLQQKSFLLWGAWLLTMGVFFSVAGFFHPYYMTEMAPAIAALFGIGIATLWSDFQRGNWRGWLLPITLVATAALQIHLLMSYPTWFSWLAPLIGCTVLVGVVALVGLRARLRNRDVAAAPRRLLAVGLGVGALLIAPAIWSGLPVIQNSAAQLPTAGPPMGGFGRGFNFTGGSRGNPGDDGANADSQLVSFLEAHQGATKFLVATPSSMTADPIILATNKPVMAMGGFMGSDPILTASTVAQDVANGTVRYFLMAGGRFGGAGFGRGGSSSASSWVTQHCATVPTSEWQSASATTGNFRGGFGGANQLYDCGGAA